ncbi:hypothetical protein KCMC57_up08070 [Kitasatospora sp. CMC57]|uniref:RNA polymerase sigma factor 70 region 4 type 2 domain-containing protein n=1 Tax=Kitasatospora sp. CMC57 TaxID=3231513 RepID=A0AB33JV36_9ACTN
MPGRGQGAGPVLVQADGDGDPLAVRNGPLLTQHRGLEAQRFGRVDLEKQGPRRPIHPEGPAVHPGSEQHHLPDAGRDRPVQQVVQEVFAFSYAEIAEAVERSEPAVRQAAHRARAHVQARRPRFSADRARQRDVTERFLGAATGGDINTLMELLSPDVTVWTDGGGKVRQALRPVVGLETVARWFAALGTVTYQGVEPGQMRAELTSINGGPGVVFRGPDRVIATLTFDFDPEGRIATIHNVANPDKLHAVAAGTRHELT